MPPRPSRLTLQTLDIRDLPSANPVVSDSFDAARFPFAPNGWDQWASNGQEYYGVTRSAANSGTQSLAVYGTVGVQSRLWNETTTPRDVTVSASVRSDLTAPILLFARGTSVDKPTASYVGVTVSGGGRIRIVESVNGRERLLATIGPNAAMPTNWLRVSLTVTDGTAAVRLQRTDTNQFLGTNRTWQATPVDAATVNTLSHKPATGFSGVGRQSGTYGTAFLDDFSVTPVRTDSLPRRFDHIRIAQLAYAGTPVSENERRLANTTVDLVVPNPTFLNDFETAAPDTGKVIYTNTSNIYGGLLTDWLETADATGVNRESAFYHVTQPTAFRGSSQSSRPVRNLWGVYRQSVNSSTPTTDLTSNATGGRSVGVTFGGVGETVGFGSLDEFRELNVSVKRSPQAGWTGVWEYASAADATGQATAWKPLSINSDSTNGLRANGQITFDPPTDWVTANQPGTSDRLFFVRYRVTAGSAAQGPELATVFGRDYVNANGRIEGTIPAFDYTADRDRDGYLNDTEWANRRAGFEARFVSETRLFFPQYGQMRFVTNPSSEAVRRWLASYHTRQLEANPAADGLFIDNAAGRLPFPNTPVLEPTGTYTADSAAAVAAVRAAVPKGLTVVNTSGGRTEANSITAAGGIAFEEFLLRPTSTNWSSFGDVVNTVNDRLNADRSAKVVVDSHPGATSITDPRTTLGVLAYYYLLADADRTFLMFYGGFAPAADWDQKWTAAAAVDVGQAKGAYTTFAQGADPQNASLVYKVFGREYENALVLYKPLSYTRGQGTGTIADATATTHQLNGNYRQVNIDGSLGPVVRQVTLRNGEGVVLMKA